MSCSVEDFINDFSLLTLFSKITFDVLYRYSLHD